MTEARSTYVRRGSRLRNQFFLGIVCYNCAGIGHVSIECTSRRQGFGIKNGQLRNYLMNAGSGRYIRRRWSFREQRSYAINCFKEIRNQKCQDIEMRQTEELKQQNFNLLEKLQNSSEDNQSMGSTIEDLRKQLDKADRQQSALEIELEIGRKELDRIKNEGLRQEIDKGKLKYRDVAVGEDQSEREEIYSAEMERRKETTEMKKRLKKLQMTVDEQDEVIKVFQEDDEFQQEEINRLTEDKEGQRNMIERLNDELDAVSMAGVEEKPGRIYGVQMANKEVQGTKSKMRAYQKDHEVDNQKLPPGHPCHLCKRVFATAAYLSNHVEEHQNSTSINIKKVKGIAAVKETKRTECEEKAYWKAMEKSVEKLQQKYRQQRIEEAGLAAGKKEKVRENRKDEKEKNGIGELGGGQQDVAKTCFLTEIGQQALKCSLQILWRAMVDLSTICLVE
uniref:CCHC-type domain-containing protein n=1 Tax=Arion vulgaris TaxID=1028688 RepID=A0A0B7BSR5_9EUPU